MEGSEDGSAIQNGLIAGLKAFLLIAIIIISIVSLTLLSIFHCVIMYTALIIIGLVLMFDPQFIGKTIIIVPAITVLILPSNFYSVTRTTVIVTATIIGLVFKYDLHQPHIVKKAVTITVITVIRTATTIVIAVITAINIAEKILLFIELVERMKEVIRTIFCIFILQIGLRIGTFVMTIVLFIVRAVKIVFSIDNRRNSN